jgi:hypothetical protein
LIQKLAGRHLFSVFFCSARGTHVPVHIKLGTDDSQSQGRASRMIFIARAVENLFLAIVSLETLRFRQKKKKK